VDINANPENYNITKADLQAAIDECNANLKLCRENREIYASNIKKKVSGNEKADEILYKYLQLKQRF
jgi:hypothetical protein